MYTSTRTPGPYRRNLRLIQNKGNLRFCQAVGDQPTGVYWLTALDISSVPATAMTRYVVQPPLLFEVRAASDPARSLEQLEAANSEIVRLRQERRDAAIGSGQVAATVLVFVKDLLTTTTLTP